MTLYAARRIVVAFRARAGTKVVVANITAIVFFNILVTAGGLVASRNVIVSDAIGQGAVGTGGSAVRASAAGPSIAATATRAETPPAFITLLRVFVCIINLFNAVSELIQWARLATRVV
jgi:hypothetical protein